MADILLSNRPELLHQLKNNKWHTEEITSKKSFGVMVVLDLLRNSNYIVVVKTYRIDSEDVFTYVSLLVRTSVWSYKEFKIATDINNREAIKYEIETKLSNLINNATLSRDSEYSSIKFDKYQLHIPKKHYLVDVVV